jgi:CRP-like cAMP-binding protein
MDMTIRSPNRLLANLTPADYELVRPHLHDFELLPAVVLVAIGDEVEDAYFPHGGIISLVVRLVHGETIEVAMVGKESVFGASAALAGPTALTTAIVQSPGICSTVRIEWLRAAADQSKTFRDTLIRHEQAIFVQTRQSVGCMPSHSALARLARWLLRARDVAGSDELFFTQESLGQMLGVRRNALSYVASSLREKGLIKFSRAQIRITDVAGLRATACECYGTVKTELEQLERSKLH